MGVLPDTYRIGGIGEGVRKDITDFGGGIPYTSSLAGWICLAFRIQSFNQLPRSFLAGLFLAYTLGL